MNPGRDLLQKITGFDCFACFVHGGNILRNNLLSLDEEEGLKDLIIMDATYTALKSRKQVSLSL